MIIAAIILAIILLVFASSLRKGLDETVWHEAIMFVTKDNYLVDFEDMIEINLNTEKQIA